MAVKRSFVEVAQTRYRNIRKTKWETESDSQQKIYMEVLNWLKNPYTFNDCIETLQDLKDIYEEEGFYTQEEKKILSSIRDKINLNQLKHRGYENLIYNVIGLEKITIVDDRLFVENCLAKNHYLTNSDTNALREIFKRAKGES